MNNKKSKNKWYGRWKGVKSRTNGKKYRWNNSSYHDCTLHPEWENFESFAKWCDENCLNDSFHIDKDILVKGNKQYGPDTCCFVPPEINQLFTSFNHKANGLPQGVSYDIVNGLYWVTVGKYKKGYFNTAEEAYAALVETRVNVLNEYVEKYRSELKEHVIRAILSYTPPPFDLSVQYMFSTGVPLWQYRTANQNCDACGALGVVHLGLCGACYSTIEDYDDACALGEHSVTRDYPKWMLSEGYVSPYSSHE